MSNYPNKDAQLMRMRPPAPYVPGPDDCTALPSQFTKAQAIGIVCKALQVMGFPRTVVLAWRSIADQTEALAWGSHTDTPVNFRKAKDLAREHGVSDRHWRRIEVQLEHAGVLARATSDNGFRGKICKGTIVFGLSLEPALRNFAYLQECASRPEQLELQRKQYLGQIRSMRHRLKKYDEFNPLSPAHLSAWADIEQQYRPARPGYASIRVLETYLDALGQLEVLIQARDLSAPQASAEGYNAQPCPPAGSQTLIKMSAPADSHVRHQYNLKYKKQTLNASSFENSKKQGKSELVWNEACLEQINVGDGIGRESNIEGATASQHCEPITPSPPSDRMERDGAGSPSLPSLTGGSRLNVAALTSIKDQAQLVEDIRKHKVGTACGALDPNHIWERFRRYNLKRDKQILPLAALRAFIKGWIPDQQPSYLEQASAIGARPKHYAGHNAQAAGPSPAISQAEAKEKQLEYYIKLLNSDQYIPPSMISSQLASELFATGKVTVDVLRARGL